MSSQTSSSATIPSVVITDDGSSGGSDPPLNRSNPDRWYFSKERLESTPSRRSGIDADKELTYRQQAANYIQDIGQRLQVNQLCINTAIVYMHRFYMFHSFAQFHRNPISAASIFLAAKVEEQPRKLEHVIKVAHYCLNREHHVQMDVKSEQYLEQSAELVMNENILLQTLGFDVAIDHPHTHVVKCCQLVRASKDLAQTSYFMATNSLHLTTMSLQYKPTVVACVCIHLACKWSSWEIPRSKEGKDWFWYVDDTVTSELLEKLTTDFLTIFNKSPSRLKKKINSLNNAATTGLSLTNAPYHGFDSSPGQNHNQARSRSPSPKRQGTQQKLSSSQSGAPAKPKPHGMPMPPHHQHKVPYPPGPPGSSANKHASHPHPHGHFSSHSSSKPHPGMPSGSNVKDPHHPHHSQHSKNPYGHGQHAHGQYPHGNRSGMQPSGSSQSHHGLGVHSKPPLPGSSSSSHPYSSSSSMKNMQSHNPSKQPPHMPPGGSSKIPSNQVPGAVKNPSQQPMFHSSSSQPHMKKPYEQARPDYGMKRETPNNPSGVHHSQNHARPYDKLADGRHHSTSSSLPPNSTSGSEGSRGSSHHGMFMGADMERSGGSGSSNPKMPFMEARSIDNNPDVNRHRSSMQQSDMKRGIPHGASASTNGNNNDSIGSLGTAGGSAAGAGDLHVPSKNAFRAPPSSMSTSTFGQSDMGATNKVHGDGFGDYGSSYGGGSSNILSIEDRRKRRHEASMLSGNSSSSSSSNTKRPRTDAYIVPTPLSTSSLFSPEELSESSKRLPPSSQFSPSAIEGAQTSYSKVPERSHHGGLPGNNFGGSSEGITFGSSGDTKPDIRGLNPSVEFQPPDLLQPINDVAVKNEPLSMIGSGSSNAPRAASLFSPEFTPSNTIPPNVDIPSPPPSTDIHKRDLFSNIKQENSENNLQSSSGFSESGSQVSFTGRLSNSPPKREDMKDSDDTHSNKKSKKKDKKHKHKHKDDKEKKHKKDKHKDKEKEKDKEKKDKHRSKDKHGGSVSGSSSVPTDAGNDLTSTKLKIKLNRNESKSSTVQHPQQQQQQQSSARHSSKTNSSSSSSSSAANHAASAPPPPLSSLKVKISSKSKARALEDDIPDDESTPCCPGFGPCLTCKRDTSQDQYHFFSSTAPSHGLTMKIAKSKETSKSSKESSSSSSSRESKKSKDKTSKTSSSSSSSTSYSNTLVLSSSRPPSMSGNHVHKNGMEKLSKKKDKSASIL